MTDDAPGMDPEEQERVRRHLARALEEAEARSKAAELAAAQAEASEPEPDKVVMDVIYSRRKVAHAEATSVKYLFVSTGFGLLAATFAVTASVWSMLSTSLTISVLLMLTVLIAAWLIAFGQIKARLIDVAADHRLQVDLMKAKQKAKAGHSRLKLAQSVQFGRHPYIDGPSVG